MNEYDITEAFRAIENELIASMIRNMDRHRAEETKEGYEWSMWQAEQLKALEKYKRENRKKYQKQFKSLNKAIEEMIREARDRGSMEQEIQIMKAIQRGYRFPGMPKKLFDLLEEMDGKTFRQKASILLERLNGNRDFKGTAEFFRLNERKLEALIKATTDDMKKAETAILRMANDQYRKAIFNAQVYANSGAGTYEKAVDMATKDMLAAGLNCVVYANGARHTLSGYARMALRTASKRAYLQGEGEKRKEWGISTVIVNKRGNPCPKCLPFVGKVLIDDVWSGGKPEDGPYPLMSTAVAHGLYHPNCKDGHTTYFKGISTADDTWTKEELEKIGQNYRKEQKQLYAERQAEKFERLSKYSLDSDNKSKYELRAGEWKKKTESDAGAVDISDAYNKFVERLRDDDETSRHKAMMALYADVTELEEDSELSAPFAYIPDEDIIKYNSKAPHVNDYDMDYVFSHETSHRMDVLEYHSWENEKFLNAIESCSKKVYAQREEIQKWFDSGGKYESSFALSDIISALGNGEIMVPVGHKKEYWDMDERFKPMEIFANLSSIDVLNLNEKEDILQEIFEAYMELTG